MLPDFYHPIWIAVWVLIWLILISIIVVPILYLIHDIRRRKRRQ
jgi:hypothetical protein